MKKLPFNFDIRCEADTDTPAEISMRGVIGTSIDYNTWSIKNTETEVINALSQIPAGRKINVRINSVGGSHQMGLGIYNALQRRKADVTTYNDGYACSAASVVCLAGSRCISPKSSVWMIHCAAADTSGNAADKLKDAEMLKACDASMAAAYAAKTGIAPEKCLEMMQAETWMSGEQAIEMKFADADSDGDTIPTSDDSGDDTEAAARQAVIATFRNIPSNLKGRLVTAQAPAKPAVQPQTTNKPNMKSIITALVAAGVPGLTESSDESQVLAALASVTNDRERLSKTVKAYETATRARVTSRVEKAITAKLIKPERKDNLIAAGIACEAALDFLDDIAPAPVGRGMTPAPRVAGEPDSIESLRKEMLDPDCDDERRADLAVKCRTLRKADAGLFDPKTARI
jgi:ATP-dependent protease ClpP protease subunit